MISFSRFIASPLLVCLCCIQGVVSHGRHKHGDLYPFHMLEEDWKDQEDFVRGGHACGFVDPTPEHELELEHQIRLHEESKAANGRDRKLQAGEYSVNVYFHVVHTSDGTGNVSDDIIQDQIKVLNEAFSGSPSSVYPKACDGSDRPSGASTPTPFKFVLKEITRTENFRWFRNADLGNRFERQMKQSLQMSNGCKDLDIYTVGGVGGTLGWAQFPDECAFDDGVVLNWQTLPGAGPPPYNEGDTGTHEVGHWLGLFHTFYPPGICDTGADFVMDTPASVSPNFGCPYDDPPNTCPNQEGNDPIHNFMDYTDDCCMYEFTPGQVRRMVDMAEMFRGYGSSTESPAIEKKTQALLLQEARVYNGYHLQGNLKFYLFGTLGFVAAATSYVLYKKTGNDGYARIP